MTHIGQRVSMEMPTALAGCPAVALCASGSLVLSSLWITYKKHMTVGFAGKWAECVGATAAKPKETANTA